MGHTGGEPLVRRARIGVAGGCAGTERTAGARGAIRPNRSAGPQIGRPTVEGPRQIGRIFAKNASEIFKRPIWWSCPWIDNFSRTPISLHTYTHLITLKHSITHISTHTHHHTPSFTHTHTITDTHTHTQSAHTLNPTFTHHHTHTNTHHPPHAS